MMRVKIRKKIHCCLQKCWYKITRDSQISCNIQREVMKYFCFHYTNQSFCAQITCYLFGVDNKIIFFVREKRGYLTVNSLDIYNDCT